MKDKLLIYVMVLFTLIISLSAGSSRTLVMPSQINMSWDDYNLSIGTLTAAGDIILEGDFIEIRGGYVNGSMIPFKDNAFDLGNSSNRWKNFWLTGDININGGIIFRGAIPKIETISDVNLTLLPDGVGITQIGDAGTPDRLTENNDDLFVSGELEVDAKLSADNTIIVSGTSGSDVLNIANDGAGRFIFSYVTDDGGHISTRNDDGTMNRNLILTEWDIRIKDHDHDTLSSDPTFFLHSSTDPDMRNDAWLGLTYAGNETANITTGAGNITLVPFDDYIYLKHGLALSQNATCTFIWSPDGSTKTEVCNA